MSTTCLIPAYDEATTIGYVLSQLSQVSAINQIIVINDGSTDNTTQITRQFNHVTLITHKMNLGKSASIKTGLQVAKNSTIFLCDADLIQLELSGLNKALQIYQTHSLDLLILRRHPTPLLNRIFKANLMLSGLRLLSSNSLASVLNHPLLPYQIELAINVYMLTHHKSIAQALIPYSDLHKITKLGYVRGFLQEISMYASLTKLLDYWKQLFTFNPPIISLVK